ncbi:MAG: DNA polymerase III subunit gamma/tau [Candidatus Eremiobacteraeota bacterium]|nr:DNA polymerase III subunit gamma/tau [Candidatus Eremiobacteraeota bacterium]
MAFDELVGQPSVVTGLQAAVAGGRVAHAYLFAGPRGTGKTSAARILAKCLNCLRGGPRPDPCGECEACLSIAAGTAFDVIEIDAASNRGINEIRELRERVKFAPAQFRYKVYIIDEVHMLTAEAFNALLKTLEEPPANVVFILATTEPHKVPQTILSRCQRYEFRRMSPDDITGRLVQVAKLEGIKSDAETLERIAFLADGALRDALVLLEQARGFANGDIVNASVVDAAFGAPVLDIVERIADAVAAGDAQGVLSAIAEAVDRGADPGWLAKELLRSLRLTLLAQVSPAVLATEVPPEAAQRIAAKASAIPRGKILAALRNLSETISQRYSAQPRIDLELALIRVVMPSDELSLQTLSDRLRTLEERLDANGRSAGPAGTVSKTPPSSARVPVKASAKKAAEVSPGPNASLSPPLSEPLSVAKLNALWPHITSAVKDRSKPCFGHLEHASIVDASAENVTLGVPSKFNRDLLGEKPMLQIIADAIFEVSGARPVVSCVVAAATEAQARSAGDASSFSLAESVLGAELF